MLCSAGKHGDTPSSPLVIFPRHMWPPAHLLGKYSACTDKRNDIFQNYRNKLSAPVPDTFFILNLIWRSIIIPYYEMKKESRYSYKTFAVYIKTYAYKKKVFFSFYTGSFILILFYNLIMEIIFWYLIRWW